MKVLVVDDEPLSATVVEMYLEDRGHTVATAHSGAQAQRLAQDFDVDVLLTDYRLGDMSASQLIHELRQQKPGLRAVILTGLSADQLELEGLEDVTVFTKPTELDDIEGAISDATPAGAS